MHFQMSNLNVTAVFATHISLDRELGLQASPTPFTGVAGPRVSR